MRCWRIEYFPDEVDYYPLNFQDKIVVWATDYWAAVLIAEELHPMYTFWVRPTQIAV